MRKRLKTSERVMSKNSEITAALRKVLAVKKWRQVSDGTVASMQAICVHVNLENPPHHAIYREAEGFFEGWEPVIDNGKKKTVKVKVKKRKVKVKRK